MTAAVVRVYVIDDHAVVRQVLIAALGEDPAIRVVGEAGTATAALRELGAAAADVAIIDLGLPDRDGVGLIETLRTLVPKTRLLVLTGSDDAHRVREALGAGAHGYLIKAAPTKDILEAVHRVARGESPVSPEVSSAVVEALHRPRSSSTGIDSLSARERQVFRLMTEGLSTRETAARLMVSPKTVETHRMKILEKLGCANVAELTRFAVRAGLVEP